METLGIMQTGQMLSLEISQYDTTELNKALEEAKKLDLNNYTEESFEALKNAISKGEGRALLRIKRQ